MIGDRTIPPVDYEIEDELEEEVLNGMDGIRERAHQAKAWASERAEAAREIVHEERDMVLAAAAGLLLVGIAFGYLIGRVDGDRQTMRAFRALRHTRLADD